jgi:hypothetical protein
LASALADPDPGTLLIRQILLTSEIVVVGGEPIFVLIQDLIDLPILIPGSLTSNFDRVELEMRDPGAGRRYLD